MRTFFDVLFAGGDANRAAFYLMLGCGFVALIKMLVR
jgi:hypothetical protein